MPRVPTARLLPALGLEDARYALGGGTWAQYPDLEKQLTVIDAADVAAVAADAGVPLTPGDTRRNLVTTGIDLPSLVGRDRKSTRLNSSHANISYAVFCLKKKKK